MGITKTKIKKYLQLTLKLIIIIIIDGGHPLCQNTIWRNSSSLIICKPSRLQPYVVEKALRRSWEAYPAFESWVACFWIHGIILWNATAFQIWTSSHNLNHSSLNTMVRCNNVVSSTSPQILKNWLCQGSSCRGVRFRPLENYPILRFSNYYAVRIWREIMGHDRWWVSWKVLGEFEHCSMECLRRRSRSLPWDASIG